MPWTLLRKDCEKGCCAQKKARHDGSRSHAWHTPHLHWKVSGDPGPQGEEESLSRHVSSPQAHIICGAVDAHIATAISARSGSSVEAGVTGSNQKIPKRPSAGIETRRRCAEAANPWTNGCRRCRLGAAGATAPRRAQRRYDEAGTTLASDWHHAGL